MYFSCDNITTLVEYFVLTALVGKFEPLRRPNIENRPHNNKDLVKLLNDESKLTSETHNYCLYSFKYKY